MDQNDFILKSSYVEDLAVLFGVRDKDLRPVCIELARYVSIELALINSLPGLADQVGISGMGANPLGLLGLIQVPIQQIQSSTSILDGCTEPL